MAFGQELPDDPYPLANAAQSGEGIFAPVDNLIYGMTPEEWYALTPEEQKRAAAAFLMRPEYQRVEYGTPGGMQGFGPSRYREIDPQKYAMGQAMLDQLQKDEDRDEEKNRARIRDQLLRDKQGYGGGSITGSGEDYSNPIYGPPMTNPGFNEEIAPRAADPNITDPEMALLAGEDRRALNQSNQNYNQRGAAKGRSDQSYRVTDIYDNLSKLNEIEAKIRSDIAEAENNGNAKGVAELRAGLVKIDTIRQGLRTELDNLGNGAAGTNDAGSTNDGQDLNLGSLSGLGDGAVNSPGNEQELMDHFPGQPRYLIDANGKIHDRLRYSYEDQKQLLLLLSSGILRGASEAGSTFGPQGGGSMSGSMPSLLGG